MRIRENSSNIIADEVAVHNDCGDDDILYRERVNLQLSSLLFHKMVHGQWLWDHGFHAVYICQSVVPRTRGYVAHTHFFFEG